MLSAEAILQSLVSGVMLGSVYGLMCIGLALIFGIMRVVNFTHGELYAFGAYCMYALVMLLGVNFFLALPMAILLGVALGATIAVPPHPRLVWNTSASAPVGLYRVTPDAP